MNIISFILFCLLLSLSFQLLCGFMEIIHDSLFEKPYNKPNPKSSVSFGPTTVHTYKLTNEEREMKREAFQLVRKNFRKNLKEREAEKLQ